MYTLLLAILINGPLVVGTPQQVRDMGAGVKKVLEKLYHAREGAEKILEGWNDFENFLPRLLQDSKIFCTDEEDFFSCLSKMRSTVSREDLKVLEAMTVSLDKFGAHVDQLLPTLQTAKENAEWFQALPAKEKLVAERQTLNHVLGFHQNMENPRASTLATLRAQDELLKLRESPHAPGDEALVLKSERRIEASRQACEHKSCFMRLHRRVLPEHASLSFVGENVEVQWERQLRSAGRSVIPEFVNLRLLPKSGLGKQGKSVVRKNLPNTGRYLLNLTNTQQTGRMAVLVEPPHSNKQESRVAEMCGSFCDTFFTISYLPSGLSSIGWPTLSVPQPTPVADVDAALMVQRLFHQRGEFEQHDGYSVIFMTNVKPEFIQAFPLSTWIKTACELHDEQGHRIFLELQSAPLSHRPEKIAYVPEYLVETVVKMCNSVRKFSEWSDQRNNELGVVKASQRAGMWPRFRVAKQLSREE